MPALLMILSGCAASGSAVDQDSSATLPITNSVVELSATTTSAPATTTASAQISPTTLAETATTTTTTTTIPPRNFAAVVHEIDGATAARMTLSWKEGCPVPLEQLRLLEISHYDFEGAVVVGELVVNEDAVGAMTSVFEQLFELGYPIEQMRLVDEFDADDMLSMQANNTSAFNCRFVAGTNRWSEHAFGRAIDVNPLINPYVRGERISPPEGAPYADRSQDFLGLIKADAPIVRAFADVGWGWGGYWSSAKDYQHFSASGS